MSYNTGNPVPSSDPRDLKDNAEKFDQALNASQFTFVDRLGRKKLTLQGMSQSATQGNPAVGAAQEALASADRAEDEADRSESARDAAVLGATGVYADTASGIAATSDGDYFSVPSADNAEYLLLYKNNAGVAVLEKTYPSAAGVNGRIDQDTSGPLVRAFDASGNVVMAAAQNGKLIVPGIEFSFQDAIGDLSDTKKAVAPYLDGLLKDLSFVPNRQTVDVFDFTADGADRAFAPAACRTGKNTMLVFCERRGVDGGGSGDFGVINIVGRKFSVGADGTVSQESIQVIAQNGTDVDGAYSYMNPCALFVKNGVNAGRAYIFYTKRYQDESGDFPRMKYSDDGGDTWSAEVSLDSTFPDLATWKLVAFGPGKGIQVQSGEHKGRLILPCWHGSPDYPTSLSGINAFLLYSDDGGNNWTIGPEYPLAGSNECQIAEDGDGNLLWIVRSLNIGKRYARLRPDMTIFESSVYRDDAGNTMFGETIVLQSSVHQSESPFDVSPSRLLFSMPTGSREDMGLWVSNDGGHTWPIFHQLTSGRKAEYSCIEQVGPDRYVVLYGDAPGTETSSNVIAADVLNLEYLLEDGQ